MNPEHGICTTICFTICLCISPDHDILDGSDNIFVSVRSQLAVFSRTTPQQTRQGISVWTRKLFRVDEETLRCTRANLPRTWTTSMLRLRASVGSICPLAPRGQLLSGRRKHRKSLWMDSTSLHSSVHPRNQATLEWPPHGSCLPQPTCACVPFSEAASWRISNRPLSLVRVHPSPALGALCSPPARCTSDVGLDLQTAEGKAKR